MNIHNHISKRRVIASGLAVAAAAGVIAGAAFFGGGSGTPAIAADQTQSAPAVENAALHQALGHGRTALGPWSLGEIAAPPLSHDYAHGGSQLSGSLPSGPLLGGVQAATADKATQVHMNITNNTHETLDLTSASHSGGSVHWENQATDLAPGANLTVSAYAATDAQINLSYTGATTGAIFQLMGKTPTVGSNEASGSSTLTSYEVNASAGSGFNPTDNYTIQPGQTFEGSNGTGGQSATYVVPPGVTSLQATVVGGASYSTKSSYGAEVQGTMAVTPGEVLTVAPAGMGQCSSTNVGGGWGLTTGDMNFSGGDGTYSSDGVEDACPGGGASVVVDPSGNVLVVAGGGGGRGAGSATEDALTGGSAGTGGSWTGQNGFPFPGGGGKAGGNSSTQGQAATGAGDLSGGAGGGGLNGGLSGMNGGGAGGGAGTSAAPGLTNATIKNAIWGADNPVTQTYISFAPVS